MPSADSRSGGGEGTGAASLEENPGRTVHGMGTPAKEASAPADEKGRARQPAGAQDPTGWGLIQPQEPTCKEGVPPETLLESWAGGTDAPPSPHNVSDVTLPIILTIKLNVVCPGFSPPTQALLTQGRGYPSLSAPRALPVTAAHEPAASERSEVPITWRYQGPKGRISVLEGFAPSFPTLYPPLLPFNIHHSLSLYSAPLHRDPPQVWPTMALGTPYEEDTVPALQKHKQTLGGDTDILARSPGGLSSTTRLPCLPVTTQGGPHIYTPTERHSPSGTLLFVHLANSPGHGQPTLLQKQF